MRSLPDRRSGRSPPGRAAARAVIGAEGSTLSHADLEVSSGRLAAGLQGIGCRRSDRVAVLMPRSPESAVAAMAIWKAGCVYVPVDPAQPVTRIAEALRVAAPGAVVAGGCEPDLLRALRDRRAAGDARMVWMDEADAPRPVELTRTEVDGLPEAPPETLSDTDPACLLFSPCGTAGARGVTMSHRDLASVVDWVVEYFGMRPEDRILTDASPASELSVIDLLAARSSGAELHHAPIRPALPAGEYPALLEGAGITVWLALPSRVSHVARFDNLRGHDLSRLRHVAWCGGVLPPPCVSYWRDRAGGTALTSLYDASDAALICGPVRVDEERELWEDATWHVVLERERPGASVHVLDPAMRPVRGGEVGELYVGGPGPAHASSSMPAGPSEISADGRGDGRSALVRTGDLAMRVDDGTVRLLGPADLRIGTERGWVHPVEVEAAVLELERVVDCAVVPVRVGRGVAKVGCAYVSRDGGPLRNSACEDHLTGCLPTDMVPRLWLRLQELPVDDRGLVDRGLLVRMFGGSDVAVD